MRLLSSFLVLPTMVTAALVVAIPASATDAEYPPGSYTVPVDMGYGKYVAGIAPGASGCSFSTYSADGQPLDTVSTFTKPLTAIVNQRVASFTTDGCTPWVRTTRVLN
ncbi:MAG: hypothetical protein ABWY93_06940 [Mycobacterium sp.]